MGNEDKRMPEFRREAVRLVLTPWLKLERDASVGHSAAPRPNPSAGRPQSRYLPQNVGVRCLFHEIRKGRHALGHRWCLRSGSGVGNQTLPNIADDHIAQDLRQRRGRDPHASFSP